MTDQTRLIALSGITKTYGQGPAAFQALSGVDLAIDAGEFVAIMGPSGSGKSTALNVLGCLDAPTTGAYVFRNVRVDQLTRNQRALLRRHYLGFVFQGFNLLARTSAQENVELPLLYRGEDAKHRHAASREALAMVGLTGWEHHTPAELSGGQQQRVAIARALAMEPEVMLFDEPTSALDPELVGEVLRVIQGLAEEGRTMIMVTHEMSFARKVSSQVMFLHQGLVEEQGSPQQVFENPLSARCKQFMSSNR